MTITTNNAIFISKQNHYSQFFIDHTYIFISNYFHDGYSKKEIKVNMAYKVNISTADLSTKLIEWLQADGVTRPFEDDVKRYYG